MIIPYVITDGILSLPDSIMRNIYDSMCENKLDKIVFSSGEINTFDKFILFMKNPANVMHTVWEEDRIQMLAWLNNFGQNYAFAHFCCWPETWGKTSVQLGGETLKYWFGFSKETGEPVLDVILGFMPKKNKLAVRYIQKVGLNILGEIPDIRFGENSDGAVLSYIKRSEVIKNGR